MATHSEQRSLPHSSEQLFGLVADVEKYPEFLPWCVGARIRSQESDLLVADLMIGFNGLNEKFTTQVKLDRVAMKIDVIYQDGPFKYLNNRWLFMSKNAGACDLDFFIDFEFKSRLLQALMGPLFGEAVRRMVGAFESRASHLYG
ncbi:type II toxin-antitoxin system RatA family toxin [Alphaproteobacteria bacterium]|nr:type II toxin-antitoxin system RatA family toxin [Alphaproteobacteria bacterium]